jgi:hypothetical protein
MSTELPDINRLSLAALNERSERYDWSEGYPEVWEVVEPSPRCPYCGELLADGETSINVTGTEHADDPLAEEIGLTFWLTVPEGYCRSKDCSFFNQKPSEEYTEHFPIYNERYGLPTTKRYGTEEADELHSVSLTIVAFGENGWGDVKHYLALTGAGMDFTWDIAEAYMLLGFLPPVIFCDLPRMAGYGKSELHQWVIAGCKRALSMECESLMRTIARLNAFNEEGKEG